VNRVLVWVTPPYKNLLMLHQLAPLRALPHCRVQRGCWGTAHDTRAPQEGRAHSHNPTAHLPNLHQPSLWPVTKRMMVSQKCESLTFCSFFFQFVTEICGWARRTLTTGWDLGRGQGCHVTMDRRSKMLGNAVAACLGLDSGHPSVSLPTGVSESAISYQSMCLSLTHRLTTTTTTTTACVGLGRRSSHFVY